MIPRRTVILHGLGAAVAVVLPVSGRAASDPPSPSPGASAFQLQGYRMTSSDALGLFMATPQGAGATQLLQGASGLVRKRRATIVGPWEIPVSTEVSLDPSGMTCRCTAAPVSGGFRVDFLVRGSGTEFEGTAAMPSDGVVLLCAAPGSSASETILFFLKALRK